MRSLRRGHTRPRNAAEDEIGVTTSTDPTGTWHTLEPTSPVTRTAFAGVVTYALGSYLRILIIRTGIHRRRQP